MITTGACSPPWSSSVMPSAFVDSASPGRNDVDSLFSASANLPGRLAPKEPKSTTSAIASTIHFAVRPAGTVRSLAIAWRSFRGWGVAGFLSERAGPAPWGCPHHGDTGVEPLAVGAEVRPSWRPAGVAGAAADRTGPRAPGRPGRAGAPRRPRRRA